MGPALPIISAISSIFGVVSSIKSYKDSKDAAKKQEEMSKLNAGLITKQAGETERRQGLVEDMRSGTSISKQAASGLAGGGSMSLYEQAQQEEFARQMGWLKYASQSKANQALLSGEVAADQTRAGGEQALWGGISDAASAAPDIYASGQTAGWW